MKLWEHVEMAEGGTFADIGAICGRVDIYGWNYTGLDKEDYQGWGWWLKLPFVQWERNWCRSPESDNAYCWCRQVIVIRHVWLGNGRRGLNGAGWQGWDWSMQLWPIE